MLLSCGCATLLPCSQQRALWVTAQVTGAGFSCTTAAVVVFRQAYRSRRLLNVHSLTLKTSPALQNASPAQLQTGFICRPRLPLSAHGTSNLCSTARRSSKHVCYIATPPSAVSTSAPVHQSGASNGVQSAAPRSQTGKTPAQEQQSYQWTKQVSVACQMQKAGVRCSLIVASKSHKLDTAAMQRKVLGTSGVQGL